MGILDASQSSGGSVNSGYTTSHSTSNTNGSAATIKAQQAAMQANQSAINAWKMAANYNSDEAAAQREWLEYMANTVYQRSVRDMKAAGINPILAAGMGLGTASVGSGAQASMANPAQFMSNTFADSNSASDSYGENHGSSWQESTSGLATALTQIVGMITDTIGKMNNGTTVNNIIDAWKESNSPYDKSTRGSYTNEKNGRSAGYFSGKLKDGYEGGNRAQNNGKASKIHKK